MCDSSANRLRIQCQPKVKLIALSSGRNIQLATKGDGKDCGLPERLTFVYVLEMNTGDYTKIILLVGHQLQKRTMFELYWYVLEDVK